MDDRLGEELLLALCRGSAGDVHLDLAELDSIDIMSIIALFRGAAVMVAGRQLVLHNAPSKLRSILELVGDALGESGVRVV